MCRGGKISAHLPFSEKEQAMNMYQRWRFVVVAESLLVALVLSFLGWQSWNAQSVKDLGKGDSLPSATTRPYADASLSSSES